LVSVDVVLLLVLLNQKLDSSRWYVLHSGFFDSFL